MKNTKNTLLKWVVGTCLVLMGVQNAFAQQVGTFTGLMKCEGTVYVERPKNWTSLYINANSFFKVSEKSFDGKWYKLTFKADNSAAESFFFVDDGSKNWDKMYAISSTGYNLTQGEGWQQGDKFTCADLNATGTLYIYDSPSNPGTTIATPNPPDAKYLYVMIPPEYEAWMSAVPMVSMDGGKTGKPLTADPDKCGWYYYVWFNETITDDVVLFRDDDTDRDDMIGFNGNWETGVDATPIPLSMLFETYEALGVNTLYFVPDENQFLNPSDDGWYDVFPDGVEGTCSYNLAAIIYDTDASLHPAFSCYSMKEKDDKIECQKGAQGVDLTTAQAAVNACIGVTPGLVEKHLDPNVSQKKRKPKLSSAGTKCFINEGFFNQLFNYTQGVNEKSCFDMPFSRASDGKWEFDSDFYKSPGVDVPGGFSPVELTTNDTILAADPNQVPVPAARTKYAAEGAIFYGPVLREDDPVEGLPKIDILCNGPGWTGGYDCTGIFGDGDETTAYIQSKLKLMAPNDCVIGWSCEALAPKGWTFYADGTEIPSEKDGKKPRWTSNVTAGGGRNQQFCFESHAQFTYKKGLNFSFRGDDDIWVFIDNTLAVDLGGTHLAAPGYVKLDNFKGYDGNNLVVGKTYPIDIFFCDRRTTMSNVRIKTNMYIVQNVAITAKGTKDKTNKAITDYEICYTKSGEGSCAAAFSETDESITCCGSDFKNNPSCPNTNTLKYYLVPGNAFDATKAEELPNGTVSKGGIDLTEPSAPKINKNNISLPPGRWTLFVDIDGKQKNVVSIRKAGEVDIVSGDATAVYFDEEDKEIDRKGYKFIKTAAAGSGSAPSSEAELVPLYISAIAGEENGKVLMQPNDAVGLTYSLDIPSGMMVFKKVDGKMTQITTAISNTIGESGVDTVYAYVPSVALPEGKSSQTFSVKVAGRTTAANILFYAPLLQFVDTLYQDASGEWVFENLNVIKGDTVIDPSTGFVEERLTGMGYTFFVVAFKPNDDGKYEPCSECNVKFTLNGTSQGISALDTNLMIVKGGATFQIISTKQYFASENNAAQIVAYASKNSYALYKPVYFTDPPCPIPSFTDVFDTNGAKPAVPMQIDEKYFSMDTEYQDGIADMVDVYYNRLIPKDSVPLALCIEWETSSATKFYPAKETVDIGGEKLPLTSKDDKDFYLLCNAVVYQDQMEVTNCDQQREVAGEVVIDSTTMKPVDYCDQRVRVAGLTLSSSPKTAGPGKITSFSAYKDRKGATVTQGFTSEVLIDRMAPIPVSATVISKKNGKGEYVGQDVLTITMSEPVKIVSADKFKVFDFYLYNAKGKLEDLYSSATRGSSFIVSSQMEPTVNEKGEIQAVYKTKNADGSEPITPHKDDYLRLSGSMTNIFWTDKTETNLGGADSIRAVVRAKNSADKYTDETYVWNSPTDFDETKRLPTPWVEISGSAENGLYSNSFAYSTYAKTDTASIVVNAYGKFRSQQEVIDKENGIPGWFVKADMLSLYNLLSEDKKVELAKTLDKIYFSYKIEVFTNLGGYVAGMSGRIYCDDKTNQAKYGRTFFGAKDQNKTCLDKDTNRNYYIGWNMISDDGRAVGSGAYISKVETFVKLGSKKDAEQSKTKVWGVKKMTNGYREYKPSGVVFEGDF